MRSEMQRRKIRAWRSAIVGAVAAQLAWCGVTSGARAETAFPHQPIHIVVGFAAGGPTDILARVVGVKLGESLGQQVVIENRTGASGNIASEAVAHAPNDGHTLLMAPLVFAVNESLFPNRRFEYGKDFTAVAPLAETANVLVVHPSFNVTSVQGLIAAAQARPGEILYATAGKGTATHLAGELFGMMAGVKMVPVHYRGGGDLVKDLLSGEIKVTFSTIPPVLDFIHQGTLRGIATTALHRDPTLPNLPTIAEAGLPGYDVRLWLGLLAPAGTPPDIVARISLACAEALKSEDVKSVLAAQGFDPLNGTPAEFDAFVRNEIAKWGGVVKQIGTIDK
jgi:tripartite-type tricarboxylate transporter receptor subunit TctC